MPLGPWLVVGRSQLDAWYVSRRRMDQLEADNDPYLSRPVRIARAIAIVASWAVWLGGLYLAVSTRISQSTLALVVVFGFAPYVVSIQLVEPWLMRRMDASSQTEPRQGHGDG